MTSSNIALYNPKNPSQNIAPFAFFVADKLLDNETLLAFKNTTQAKLLIAINASEPENSPQHDCLSVADTVVYCKADEVDMLIEVFGKFFTGDTFVSIDEEEAVEIFQNKSTVYFTYAQGVADNTIGKIDNAVKIAVEEMFTHTPLQTMCVLLESNKDMGFEEFTHLTSAVSEYPYSDEMDIFYGLNLRKSKKDSIDLWIFGVK